MPHKLCIPLLLLVLIVVGQAQTSDGLRERFGKPSSETFLAQPGIYVAAAYAADGQACEMLIEPPHSLLQSENGQAPLMPTAVVSELIDELVPTDTRGGKGMASITYSGCNSIAITQYTHLTIMRSQHNCKPDSPDRDIRVAITFKDRTCAGR
jgi:hypothetical protein